VEPESAPRRFEPLPLRLAKPTRSRRRLRRRQALVGLLLLPAIAIAAFSLTIREFLRPEYLSARLEEALDDRFAVGLSIRTVEVSFPDRVAIRDIVLASPPGSRFPRLAEVPLLSGRLRLWPLLRGRVELRSLRAEGAEIYVERDSAGVCTLARAVDARSIEALEEGGFLAWTPPSITLGDVRVHTCPESVFQTERPLHISTLLLRYQDPGSTSFVLSGRAEDVAVEGIVLDGSGNFATGDLRASLRVDRLLLDEAFRDRLPEPLRKVWDKYPLCGTADVVHHLALHGGTLIENRAVIALSKGSLRMTEPPVALDEVSGRIEVTRSSLRIVDPLQGRAFSGLATLTGAIELLPDGPGGGDIQLRLRGVYLDAAVREALPPELRAEWDWYSPRGVADVSLAASGSRFPPTLVRTHLDFRGVDIAYKDYPYPLERLSGSVVLSSGEISVDLASPPGSPRTAILGRAFLEAGLPQHVQVDIEGLPLDAKLRAALPPENRATWDEYSPSGVGDLRIRVLRDRAGERQRTEVRLTARDGAIRHEAFPLAVEGITGEVLFLEDRTELRGLRGHHGDSEIRLEAGDIVHGDAGRVDVTISSTDLALTPSVIAALPPETREVAEEFGFTGDGANGRLATEVSLVSIGHAPLEIEVSARIVEPVRVVYDEFPWPLVFHSGEVEYRSVVSGVQISALRTSPDLSPIIQVTGDHIRPDPEDPEHRWLSLEIEVLPGPEERGLEVSAPDLVACLPPDLKLFSERMELAGEVDGRVSVVHRVGGAGPEEVRYEGQVRIRKGSVDFGLELFDLGTDVIVEGGYGPGEPHHFHGVLRGGSYRFTRFAIDNPGETSFVYGEVHPLIALHEQLRKETKGYLPTSHFTETLAPDRVEKVFQAAIGPAKMYGGDLDGFFYVDLADDGMFGGEAECREVDLSLGSNDIFGTPDISGLASGQIQVRGRTQDAESMTGFGKIYVRAGKLSRIPALAAIFLNPLKGLSRGNQNVHKAEASYRIRDRKFVVEELGDLRLESEVVEILGKGTLDFDNELDLLFEPQTLFGIPIISDIVNTLARFRLKGNLDDPEVFGEPSQE